MEYSKLNLDQNKEIAQEIIQLACEKGISDRKDFEKLRNSIVKKNKAVIFSNLYFIKAYKDLLLESKIDESCNLMSILRKRSVRSKSGVASVSVLMKPFPCPGKCIYCPSDSRMPKSYLVNQPAAQRAFRQKFDPYNQVNIRLRALSLTGHEVSKIELRIIGGTFSAYKKQYQKWFIKRCLLAMNEFKSLNDRKSRGHRNEKYETVVKLNEKSNVRCIAIDIETRPDFITADECKRLRILNVTKVELGIQSIYDSVQKLTNRGHYYAEVVNATKLLRDAGFKISFHVMPNLPGTTKQMDMEMAEKLFSDDNLKPDFVKIYPCVVLRGTVLEKWYKDRKYNPYNDVDLFDVLYEYLKLVPEYCRVDRVLRDIPANDIVAGSLLSNFRQLLDVQSLKDKIHFKDIRSREISDFKFDLKNVKLLERKYIASDGIEYFLSYEDVKNDKLLAMLRLRLTKNSYLNVLKNAAIIRELHVYGQQIPVGRKSDNLNVQHFGFGKKLMKRAESIAKEAGFKKVAVISGLGVREYYRKLGYVLRDTYLLKRV